MFAWLFSKPLEPGADAPDFTLADQDGNLVSLGALRGKNVVLVFYPGDDTTLCTRQLCEFRDQSALLEAKNAVLLGINPASAVKHAQFRSKYRFEFPLLIDHGQLVGGRYGAKGLIVKRTVYLIGKSGKIRYARRGKPVPEEVLAAAE